MPRFYTHSATLGDVPLKARTLDEAIAEVRTGDWPDQTMDIVAVMRRRPLTFNPPPSRSRPPGPTAVPYREEPYTMNLIAMLVSLRPPGPALYDREASNHVAAHHDASASAGRYQAPGPRPLSPRSPPP